MLSADTHPPEQAIVSGSGALHCPLKSVAASVRRRNDCEDRVRSLMVVGCGLVTAGVTRVETGLSAFGATCPPVVAGPGPDEGAGLIRSLTTRR